MRKPRHKMIGRPCYYHLFNRVAGAEGEHPFSDICKEFGFKLLSELSQYYLIEVISAAFMGNHFHVVAYVPSELPTNKFVADRHNEYHGVDDESVVVPPWKFRLDSNLNRDKCDEVAKQMIDVSCFMKVFQQRYTVWFNKMYKRRGTLWGGRFKSTILEGSRESLWNCVKYVEMNPVRAGIVDDPADYRFCTWGRMSGSGEHPFHKAFVSHIRGGAELHAGEYPESLSDDDVIAEFRGELARIRAWEKGKDAADVQGLATKARLRRETMPVRCLRRTRHWTEGVIIGSKMFVREVGCMFDEKERILRKQLSRGAIPGGGVLYCFKRLL